MYFHFLVKVFNSRVSFLLEFSIFKKGRLVRFRPIAQSQSKDYTIFATWIAKTPSTSLTAYGFVFNAFAGGI